jgi:NitT/TauT family transport system substrate-binding protein
MVRKALIDSGKFKTAADLKGLRWGQPAPGVSFEVEVSRMLKDVGLTYKDMQVTYLGQPDTAAAFASGVLDAAIVSEPILATVLTQGTAVIFKRSDEIGPNTVSGMVMASPAFLKNAELAQRFMVGFLRGVRLYNDAIVKKIPAAKTKLIDAAVANYALKDRAVYESFLWLGIHPDGILNEQSLSEQQDYFISAGLQQGGKADTAKFVDKSLRQYAVAKLGGPYK